MNTVAAIVPWSIGIGSFVISVIGMLRWSRVRVIQRDPRGDAPLLLDVVDGVAYDADRHPTSTAGVHRQDLKLLPKFSSKEYSQAAAIDQAVDLATRGFPNQPIRRSLETQTGKVLQPGPIPKIEVIDAAQAEPLFHDVVPIIFQDAIEAEIVSEGESQ